MRQIDSNLFSLFCKQSIRSALTSCSLSRQVGFRRRPRLLIEGVTVASPPRLSQPHCSAPGKYSNRLHREEAAPFTFLFFLAFTCENGKNFILWSAVLENPRLGGGYRNEGRYSVDSCCLCLSFELPSFKSCQQGVETKKKLDIIRTFTVSYFTKLFELKQCWREV